MPAKPAFSELFCSEIASQDYLLLSPVLQITERTLIFISNQCFPRNRSAANSFGSVRRERYLFGETLTKQILMADPF